MLRHRMLVLAVVCFAATLGSSPAWAQRVAGDTLGGGALVARLRWVQFDVVGGRLTATPLHQGTNITTSTTINNRRENLSINLSDDRPDIRYEMTSPGDEVRLEVQEGTQFRLQRTKGTGSDQIRVELFQPDDGEPLKLSIVRGEQTVELKRRTLWHLLLEEPQITGELLGPLFDLLRPGWKIATLMESVERVLCEEARFRRRQNFKAWAAAVAQLASPKYPERTAAERVLLSAGREVLPYLRSLDRASLDAEQRRRIRSVLESLDSSEGDSLEQIVGLLSSDPVTWVSLLNRPDLAKRKLAHAQLEQLLGRAIEFDPVETDEPKRAEQLARLRGQLLE